MASKRFAETDIARRERNLKVIGFEDLRPINWFTGKREPLAAGEGNICDRCGLEHAKVYTLQDVDTRETFKVGSTCATRAFGFDPEKDAQGKRFVKQAQRDAETKAMEERKRRIEEYAAELAPVVGRLPLPKIELVERRRDSNLARANMGEHSEKWGMADAYVWRHGIKEDVPLSGERLQSLIESWTKNRAVELLPEELRRSEIGRSVAAKVMFKLARGPWAR